MGMVRIAPPEPSIPSESPTAAAPIQAKITPTPGHRFRTSANYTPRPVRTVLLSVARDDDENPLSYRATGTLFASHASIPPARLVT